MGNVNFLNVKRKGANQMDFCGQGIKGLACRQQWQTIEWSGIIVMKGFSRRSLSGSSPEVHNQSGSIGSPENQSHRLPWALFGSTSPPCMNPVGFHAWE